MSINSIRLSAYGFRMEAVGSKKFIKRERDAFLEFAAGRVNETAQKLAEAVCAEPLHPFFATAPCLVWIRTRSMKSQKIPEKS